MSHHIIVGAGQVGTRLATLLTRQGHTVRLVSRSGNTVPGVEACSADAGDRDALLAATVGADVIYNCVNPPYHLWVSDWPPVPAVAAVATPPESCFDTVVAASTRSL